MPTCDKCGKNITFSERSKCVDQFDIPWKVCSECKEKIELDKIKFNEKLEKEGDLHNTFKNYKKRPLGISILAFLMIVYGIFGIFSLIFIITSSIFVETSISLLYAVLTIILGAVTIFYLAIGYSFLKGLKWSWFLAVIITIISIVSSITKIVTFQEIVQGTTYIIIYVLLLVYLTRPHVKNYFGISNSGDIISSVKKSKKMMVLLVVTLVVIALVPILSFIQTSESMTVNVSHAPENPQPGDEITFIAEVSGGPPFIKTGALCKYSTLKSKFGGGGTMDLTDINKYSYSAKNHPVEDGTEIWYMILAGNQIYDGDIIQVGNVERSNTTSINIGDVEQFPESPSNTNSVQINANITSNVNISGAWITCFIFYPIDSIYLGRSSYGKSMTLINTNTYSYTLFLNPHEPMENEKCPSGTKIFYRIKTEDESGNTDLSKIYNFIMT